MFSLEKKIQTEQRFANLVYKDFQTKKFGLTPCCDADIEKIKWKKYLCDYQDQKEHDDNLKPTENLTITVLDCDNLPVQPAPTPPDNTPVVPVEGCKSLEFDGVNEELTFNTPSNPSIYNFIDHNNAHSLSFWIQWTLPSSVQKPIIFFSKYDYTSSTGIIFGVTQQMRIHYQLSIGGFTDALVTIATYPFVAGQWYNITITTDGADAANTITYVNGSVVSSTIYRNALTGSVQGLNTRYRIANVGVQNPEKRGYYSQFIAHSLRGWNTILAPADVTNEYNNGIRLVTPVQSGSLNMNLQFYNSVWNGSDFDVPETVQSVNFTSNTAMEQIDLLNTCPQ
jgi:hypothetical protein